MARRREQGTQRPLGIIEVAETLRSRSADELVVRVDASQRWRNTSSVRTSKVPWADCDWDFCKARQAIAIINLKPTPYLTDFVRRQLALVVFDTNRMEGTIRAEHREGPTMRRKQNFIDCVEPEPPITAWDAEGGRDSGADSTARQLFQFVAAVKYLLYDNVMSDLTSELMENSYNLGGGNRVPLVVGRMRSQTNEDVNAGWYQFLPPQSVGPAVEDLLSTYATKLADGTHPVSLATCLFYELITIHPFSNGNGRPSRLFLAWSLMRDGFPFPVNFSSGHKSRRQHFLHAINSARRVDNGYRGELNVILLESIDRVLGNYHENVRLIERRTAAE